MDDFDDELDSTLAACVWIAQRSIEALDFVAAGALATRQNGVGDSLQCCAHDGALVASRVGCVTRVIVPAEQVNLDANLTDFAPEDLPLRPDLPLDRMPLYQLDELSGLLRS